MYPSLIAGEDHTEFALERRNLEVEALVISFKYSDTTLARLLVGRICINNMSLWCLVGVTFGLFYPDIAFKQTADFFVNFWTDMGSGNPTC